MRLCCNEVIEKGSVPVVLTLHERLRRICTLAQIAELDTVVEPPCMIRIENL